MTEKRPAPRPPEQRPAASGRDDGKRGGWEKPVKPPTGQRPGGLPPKKGS